MRASGFANISCTASLTNDFIVLCMCSWSFTTVYALLELCLHWLCMQELGFHQSTRNRENGFYFLFGLWDRGHGLLTFNVTLGAECFTPGEYLYCSFSAIKHLIIDLICICKVFFFFHSIDDFTSLETREIQNQRIAVAFSSAVFTRVPFYFSPNSCCHNND